MKFLSKETTRLLCFFLILSLLLFLCTLRESRERAILSVVRSACAEFGVPLPLVLAVIRTESNFRKNATSSAGARGYMQLMPETFHDLVSSHESLAYTDAQITDTVANIRCGTYYLSYLLSTFSDPRTALAAYNAGEGNVRGWLEDDTLSANGVLHTIPFKETRTYVERVLHRYQFYLDKYKNNEGAKP